KTAPEKQTGALAAEAVIDKPCCGAISTFQRRCRPSNGGENGKPVKIRRCARNCKRRAPPHEEGISAWTREPGDLPSPSSVPGRDQPAVRGAAWVQARAVPPRRHSGMSFQEDTMSLLILISAIAAQAA